MLTVKLFLEILQLRQYGLAAGVGDEGLEASWPEGAM